MQTRFSKYIESSNLDALKKLNKEFNFYLFCYNLKMLYLHESICLYFKQAITPSNAMFSGKLMLCPVIYT